jgi:SAM-dependent methyltransferase
VSIRYRALYRLGFTPWDQEHVPSELAAIVTGPSALSPGSALDVGCGTGTQAVYLAENGWQVTAVDAVAQALAQGRRRTEVAGVAVRWVLGDVTLLSRLDLAGGFTLVHDRGCFHDLADGARDAYVQGVSSLAAPGATFLLMAFARRPRRFGMPPGASEEEIRKRFGSAWEMVSVQSDSGPDPHGPMRNVPRIWYRLRRR